MKTNKKFILSVFVSLFQGMVELLCIHYAYITNNDLLSTLILISLILQIILLLTKNKKSKD